MWRSELAIRAMNAARVTSQLSNIVFWVDRTLTGVSLRLLDQEVVRRKKGSMVVIWHRMRHDEVPVFGPRHRPDHPACSRIRPPRPALTLLQPL